MQQMYAPKANACRDCPRRHLLSYLWTQILQTLTVEAISYKLLDILPPYAGELRPPEPAAEEVLDIDDVPQVQHATLHLYGLGCIHSRIKHELGTQLPPPGPQHSYKPVWSCRLRPMLSEQGPSFRGPTALKSLPSPSIARPDRLRP